MGRCEAMGAEVDREYQGEEELHACAGPRRALKQVILNTSMNVSITAPSR